jgi:hypothetical protein
MRTAWALKEGFQKKRTTGGKGEKVQRLVTRESWPGVVLFRGVFYNYCYVKRLCTESKSFMNR